MTALYHHEETDFVLFTINQKVRKKHRFRDTLTFKKCRPGGVFLLGEEAKNWGKVAINAES